MNGKKKDAAKRRPKAKKEVPVTMTSAQWVARFIETRTGMALGEVKKTRQLVTLPQIMPVPAAFADIVVWGAGTDHGHAAVVVGVEGLEDRGLIVTICDYRETAHGNDTAPRPGMGFGQVVIRPSGHNPGESMLFWAGSSSKDARSVQVQWFAVRGDRDRRAFDEGPPAPSSDAMTGTDV